MSCKSQSFESKRDESARQKKFLLLCGRGLPDLLFTSAGVFQSLSRSSQIGAGRAEYSFYFCQEEEQKISCGPDTLKNAEPVLDTIKPEEGVLI